MRTRRKIAVGGHEAVGVEGHGKFVFIAPSLAEVANIAGLVAGIDVAAPVGECETSAPTRRKRAEACFLDGRYFGIARVAQNVDMKAVADSSRAEAAHHRFEIADHPLRRFIADAHQNRGRCRYRLVAADAGCYRDHRCDRIGGKAHDEEADRGVPESGHHPRQRHRE